MGSENLTLTGDEAAHCVRVLRRQVGDEVEVFDGNGCVVRGKITSLTKVTVSIQPLLLKQHEPRQYEIHLLPAMIKAEPFEWLLEKATELGATSVQPVITQRTVVSLNREQLDKKLSKWQRLMIESAKQCHTPWLPQLHQPRGFSEVITSVPEAAARIIPALSEHSRRLHELSLAQVKAVYILIGPEGDFTPEEEALAQKQAGFQPVTLGPLILRAETAAIAALAMVSHELARQSV